MRIHVREIASLAYHSKFGLAMRRHRLFDHEISRQNSKRQGFAFPILVKGHGAANSASLLPSTTEPEARPENAPPICT